MPLSLTCTCGAKLEIDDKFAGKVIACPDCRKELSTVVPTLPAAKTSGYALASFILALIGPFTFIAPLLAVGCGFIGLRHIAAHPREVGGVRLAWAGIVLGCLFATLSVGGYLSPEVLRVDGVFREIEWAGKLDFSGKLTIEIERGEGDLKFNISRVRRTWGKISQSLGKFQGAPDDLILVDPWDDAQVACMNSEYRFEGEDRDIVLDRGLKRFLESELVHNLVHPSDKKAEPPRCEEGKKETIPSPPDKTVYEMTVSLYASGPPRTFLLRVIKVDSLSKLFIVAGGTRASRFERMEPELRKSSPAIRSKSDLAQVASRGYALDISI